MTEVSTSTRAGTGRIGGAVAGARLVIAWIVTMTGLVYLFFYNLIRLFVYNRPHHKAELALAALVAAIWIMTYRLGKKPWLARRFRIVASGLVTCWIMAFLVLVSRECEPTPERWIVGLLAAFGSLWFVWVAWFFYVPYRASVRLLVLAALLLPALLCVFFTDVQGLSGTKLVTVGLRGWSRRPTATRREETVQLPSLGEHDCPSFRGLHSDAVVENPSLVADGSQLPIVIWRRPMGRGWGSFAVVGDYGFTQEQRGPTECVVCYDLRDGAELWAHADAACFDKGSAGPGPRATPTVVEDRLYTIGATGLLNCLRASDGEALWKVDVLEDNGCRNSEHGVAASPLVVDGLVIVTPMESAEKALAAYDIDTGKRVWVAGGGPAGFSTPIVADICGQRQILCFSGAGLASYDIPTGVVLWFFEWKNGNHTNCAQPVVLCGPPDRIVLSTAYGTGTVCVEVVLRDAWEVQRVWTSRHLQSHFSSPILVGKCLYGLNNRILTCLDVDGGERQWKGGRYGHGQMLLLNGRLLVQTEAGDLVLLEPDPFELREIARLDGVLPGKTWNVPVLAADRLLLRNDREAVCLQWPSRNPQAENVARRVMNPTAEKAPSILESTR